jgi:hypothetical protein
MSQLTPKEKAQEIVKKFDLLVTTWDCYNDTQIDDEEILKDTKKCGIIVVDEILKSFDGFMDARKNFRNELEIKAERYLLAVRAEIEKL